MKFERQRPNQAVPDKFELNNQQFLTFRNNPVQQNSGRTVYSQKFDYKSLERYDKAEDKEDQNFNFHKNLKNLRSQDKYKQLKEQAMLFQTTEENNESQIGSIERKQELRNKLAKLRKNLKREQKKQVQLKEEITMAENEIDEFDEAHSKQQNDINELVQIFKDNEKNISFMNRKLEQYIEKQRQFKSQIDYLDDTMEGEMKTGRSSEHSTLEFQKKLMVGLKQLQIYSNQMEQQVLFYQAQIDSLKANLQAAQSIDIELINALSK